jgi:hypothetical protein
MGFFKGANSLVNQQIKYILAQSLSGDSVPKYFVN